MELLDNLKNQFGGNQQQGVLSAVSALITNNGGLSALISRFTQNGLGQHVQSWVGKGENMPITGEHVRQVFSANQIQQVAQQLGTDPAQSSNMIAQVLPGLIDKATPQGQVVGDEEAQHGISSLLSGGISSLLGRKQ